jgi:hypothetical protein
MELLIIEKTNVTPEIRFNPFEGILMMKGRSIPENPVDFYSGLMDWIKEYYSSPKEITEFLFEFEYVNSGSAKFILEILRKVRMSQDQGKTTMVRWFYEEEDEAIQELGEYFRDMLKIPIELIPVVQN